jgi:hypothetical protein
MKLLADVGIEPHRLDALDITRPGSEVEAIEDVDDFLMLGELRVFIGTGDPLARRREQPHTRRGRKQTLPWTFHDASEELIVS